MFFFFFQAEDGIRDLTVTGVQTCALPISFVSGLSLSVGAFVQARTGGPRRLARVKVPAFLPRWWEISPGRYTPVRSEERRVGKERRAGWEAEHQKKKSQGC